LDNPYKKPFGFLGPELNGPPMFLRKLAVLGWVAQASAWFDRTLTGQGISCKRIG